MDNPSLISEIASVYGSQAIIVSIDTKVNLFGGQSVHSFKGRRRTSLNPISWAIKAVELGAGEILLTSVSREGTWSGFDLELVSSVVSAVSVPVICHGGAGKISHIHDAVHIAGASL